MQALELAERLAYRDIVRIVSSPYARARQSISPLADCLGIEIDTDDRLIERVLGADGLPDWQDHLSRSFIDLDYALPGGESSRAAMRRGLAVVDDNLNRVQDGSLVIVTHGNLLALILKHFDDRIGYEDWRSLTNPDVYSIEFDSSCASLRRIGSA